MKGAKAKDKSMSKSAPAFVKGGSGKMFGKQSVGTQVPGGTATKTSGGGGMFAKGGSKKMFGKQSASAKASGTTGK